MSNIKRHKLCICYTGNQNKTTYWTTCSQGGEINEFGKSIASHKLVGSFCAKRQTYVDPLTRTQTLICNTRDEGKEKPNWESLSQNPELRVGSTLLLQLLPYGWLKWNEGKYEQCACMSVILFAPKGPYNELCSVSCTKWAKTAASKSIGPKKLTN